MCSPCSGHNRKDQQAMYNQGNQNHKPALMVDSNGCFDCSDLNSPKAKGRFGLAWVAETPDCPCPEPIGWQVEFVDTPSKVEQRCKEMVRWINCPPMLPRCEPCPPEECYNPCCPPRCNPCVPQTTPCLPKCCTPCCSPCNPCVRCCPPKCGIPKSTPPRCSPCCKPCCLPCCATKCNQGPPRVAGGGGCRGKSPPRMYCVQQRCCPPPMCTCRNEKIMRRRSPRRKSPKKRRCTCCDSEVDMCTCTPTSKGSCCKCKQELPKCTCNRDDIPTKDTTTMESTSPSSAVE